MKTFEAQVIEDNGGGLTLYVFDENGIDGGIIRWAHGGYEFSVGTLTDDIQALINGDDPLTDWEGNMGDPQQSWDRLDNYEYGWKVVAQVADGKCTLYPKDMGKAAMLEFGVSI